MALEQITFNIGAFNDSDAGGNNYFTNTVFEVKNQSDNTFATIYADSSGTTQIPQNGIDNVSNSRGECNFYIDDGDFYIEVDSQQKNFKTGSFKTDFASVDEVKAYSKLLKLIGQRITTGEYHAGTGYGGASYDVVSSGSVAPNGIDIIQGVTDSGAAIVLASQPTAERFGVKHDESFNSTNQYNRAVEYVSLSGGGVLPFEVGGVVVTDGVIPKSYVTLKGLGRFASFLVASPSCLDVVLHLDDPANPDLRGFGIEDMGIDGKLQLDGGRGLAIVANNNLGSFRRLYIVNTKQQGILIDGQRFSSGIDFATYPRTKIKGGKWNYIDDLIIFNCGLATSGDRDNIHIKDSTGPFIDNIQSAFNSNGAAIYLENAAEFNCGRFECWETVNAVKVEVTEEGRESGLCYIKDLKADYIEQDGIVLNAGLGSIERFNIDKFRAGSIGDTADNTYSVVKLIGSSNDGGFVEDCVIKGVQNQRNVDTTESPKYIVECEGKTRQNYFEVERAEDYGTNISNSMNDDSGYNTRNEIVVNKDLTQHGVAEFFRLVPISTSQTSITVAHPLKTLPRRVLIQARNSVAANAGNTYWSATSTDITISITGSVPTGDDAEFDVYLFRGEDTDKAGEYGDSIS